MTYYFYTDQFLDLYENKIKGIFKVLDDMNKMPCQTTQVFVQNVFANWSNSPVLAVPKSHGIQEEDGFLIRHYVGDVFYNVVRFSTSFQIAGIILQ